MSRLLEPRPPGSKESSIGPWLAISVVFVIACIAWWYGW